MNEVTVTLRDVRGRKDFNRRKQLFDMAIKNIPGRPILTDLEGLAIWMHETGDTDGEKAVRRALDVLGLLRAAVRGGPVNANPPARF